MEKLYQVFDGHNDTILKLEIAARRSNPIDFSQTSNDLDIDLIKARNSGFLGGFFAMFTPSDLDFSKIEFDLNDPRNFLPISQQEALNFTLSMFSRMHRLANQFSDHLTICHDVISIRKTMSQGKIAIVPHVEGAECIDENFEVLQVLYAAGLRSLGLVWSRANAFAQGAPMGYQPKLDPGIGLSELGFELVSECNRLGILIDVSHLSEAGFWDVARTSKKPLIATHSNAYAISQTPRNLTDQQLVAIAESSGVAGLNFHVGFLNPKCDPHRDASILDILNHLEHMLKILGEDGVAIGSDFDGCVLPSTIGDVSGLPKFTKAMEEAQFGKDLIKKICSENWLSVMEKSLKKPTD